MSMFDTERFIEEIQRRPAIYDVKRGEYNDRNAKMTAWDEVCQVMVPNWAHLTDEDRNIQEKNLRGKWRNIRDYFMKELKLQKSHKNGPAGRKRKKYVYFDRLLFLMPTVENKRNSASLSPPSMSPTPIICKEEESEGEVDNPVIEEYDVPLAHGGSVTGNREFLQGVVNVLPLTKMTTTKCFFSRCCRSSDRYRKKKNLMSEYKCNKSLLWQFARLIKSKPLVSFFQPCDHAQTKDDFFYLFLHIFVSVLF
ncbi:uncharacterized protein LOC109861604 isoform X2 [Pseudomyrmex gracilis]|uniref:uncharacterized protein LOC109861604 isoform X2 n=1 Tax=Pseudomyrmex gracilis TaxID=219809 RepID=UPI000995ACD3|nr:uncharacterized protein LOC109861604 isoform X2 [Pseudomyrmex gracilis]